MTVKRSGIYHIPTIPEQEYLVELFKNILIFTKISIIDEKFDFFKKKFRFLTKISIFYQNFAFSENFYYWPKIAVFRKFSDICKIL